MAVIALHSGSEALASMQDAGQILGIDAEPFCRFLDRQPLANDEADCRPIQGGFGPCVVLALHFSLRASTVGERRTGSCEQRGLRETGTCTQGAGDFAR